MATGQRFLKPDHSVPMTSPAMNVAAIPMMAMDKGDWFPVSFSCVLADVGVSVSVAAITVFVEVALGVEVVGTTVTILMWTTVITIAVCVGTGVAVTEAVKEGVGVGEEVTDGVNKLRGPAFACAGHTGIKVIIDTIKKTRKSFAGFILHRPYQ